MLFQHHSKEYDKHGSGIDGGKLVWLYLRLDDDVYLWMEICIQGCMTIKANQYSTIIHLQKLHLKQKFNPYSFHHGYLLCHSCIAVSGRWIYQILIQWVVVFAYYEAFNEAFLFMCPRERYNESSWVSFPSNYDGIMFTWNCNRSYSSIYSAEYFITNIWVALSLKIFKVY